MQYPRFSILHIIWLSYPFPKFPKASNRIAVAGCRRGHAAAVSRRRARCCCRHCDRGVTGPGGPGGGAVRVTPGGPAGRLGRSRCQAPSPGLPARGDASESAPPKRLPIGLRRRPSLSQIKFKFDGRPPARASESGPPAVPALGPASRRGGWQRGRRSDRQGSAQLWRRRRRNHSPGAVRPLPPGPRGQPARERRADWGASPRAPRLATRKRWAQPGRERSAP